MLEKLIGAQITFVGDDYIEVKLNDENYKLEIMSDYGGCCGFAEFSTNLLYSPNDLRNPIITDIVQEDEDVGYKEWSTVTLYGEYKPLVSIESEAGSGSGFEYGAFVSLRCKELGIDEEMVSW